MEESRRGWDLGLRLANSLIWITRGIKGWSASLYSKALIYISYQPGESIWLVNCEKSNSNFICLAQPWRLQTWVNGKDNEIHWQSIGNNAIQQHGKAASASGTSQIAKQKMSPSFTVTFKLPPQWKKINSAETESILMSFFTQSKTPEEDTCLGNWPVRLLSQVHVSAAHSQEMASYISGQWLHYSTIKH